MSVKNLPSESLDQALGDLSHSHLREVELAQTALDAHADVVRLEKELDMARFMRGLARAALAAFRAEHREAA
jgi:hypothetical protein